MRLSEDRDSWKARAIIRRDFRHLPEIDDESAGPRGKKKAKKSRKKIGHKHNFIQVEEPIWSYTKDSVWPIRTTKIVTKCEFCGKRKHEKRSYYWQRKRAMILAGSGPQEKGL